jgi:hypothetical protein
MLTEKHHPYCIIDELFGCLVVWLFGWTSTRKPLKLVGDRVSWADPLGILSFSTQSCRVN